MADLPSLVNIARYGLDEGKTLVMFSGGGDSVALLELLVRARGSDRLGALHVNYGLRGAESDDDERFCRETCDRLGVALFVEHATLDAADSGNLHHRARSLRYGFAAAVADREGFSRIAVAHTADDQAETVLYRMFCSPGSRALAGIPAVRGRIVRPLLEVRRAALRDWCVAAGVRWREDSANADRRFARARVRSILRDASAVHPAAVENLLRSARELGDEREALDAVVDDLLRRTTADDGALLCDELAAVPAALARLVLRSYVERSTGGYAPAAKRVLADVLRLAAVGGSHTLQIEGASLLVEYGRLLVEPLAAGVPAARPLEVPGELGFGDWRITAILPGGATRVSKSAAPTTADTPSRTGPA
ncbi:MAG: tRNA lysidine(34) synthetase TilS, partial [Solirubrobacterales bacterium]